MRLLSSFFWAGRGALWFIQRERNARIQLAIAEVAFFADYLLGMPRTVTLYLILASGAVLAMEAMNAALERTIDLITGVRLPLAGEAKDLAAGAVLIAALAAFAMGLVLFWPFRVQLAGALAQASVWADLAFILVLILTISPFGLSVRRPPSRDSGTDRG